MDFDLINIYLRPNVIWWGFVFFFSPDYFKHDLDHRKQSVSELSLDNPSPDYTEQLQEAMN